MTFFRPHNFGTEDSIFNYMYPRYTKTLEGVPMTLVQFVWKQSLLSGRAINYRSADVRMYPISNSIYFGGMNEKNLVFS